MRQFIKKLLKIPLPEAVIVEAIETYEVHWESRHGEYSIDTRPEIEVLTSKEDAELFSAALTNAFKLLRHVGRGTSVEVRKRD
jgi:hypothetical protein